MSAAVLMAVLVLGGVLWGSAGRSGSVPSEPDQVALAFARAWVVPDDGVSSREWVAGLRPYSAPALWADLSTVDPARVPSTRVTSDPRVQEIGEEDATVDVSTDAVVLRIILRKTVDGWRVLSYNSAKE